MWSHRVRQPPARAGPERKEACPGCGLVFREATVLPALGHDMVDHTILAPTCTTDGMQQSVCSRCELIGPLKSVPATGHDMQTRTVLAPTCTAAGMEQEGLHALRRDRCADESARARPRLYGRRDGADVRNAGLHDATCGRCGDHFTDSYIAPHGPHLRRRRRDARADLHPRGRDDLHLLLRQDSHGADREAGAQLCAADRRADVHGAWLHGLCLRALRRPDDGRLCPRAGP